MVASSTKLCIGLRAFALQYFASHIYTPGSMPRMCIPKAMGIWNRNLRVRKTTHGGCIRAKVSQASLIRVPESQIDSNAFGRHVARVVRMESLVNPDLVSLSLEMINAATSLPHVPVHDMQSP
jgi:hypothetical protein